MRPMSDDGTPTTDEVREEWQYGRQEVDMEGYVIVSFDEAGNQFDRWLDSVREEAWAEGHAAALGDDAALARHDRRVRAEALRRMYCGLGATGETDE